MKHRMGAGVMGGAVYHVSEEPNIELFRPRMPPAATAGLNAPVVWAIAKTHLVNYLLPRECPRVCWRTVPGSSEQDRPQFPGSASARQVVAIEARWLERAASCVLWLYEFCPGPFVCSDATAGYFVSRVPVVPVSRRRIERPLDELLAHGAELRVVPSLLVLADAVASSTLAFSCIRMRNAGVGPRSAWTDLPSSP